MTCNIPLNKMLSINQIIFKAVALDVQFNIGKYSIKQNT